MYIVRLIVVAGALALTLAAPVVAQTTTGQIIGRVVDAKGTGVSSVAITATSPQLPGSLAVLTDGSGRYALFALPPGTYAIEAALTGFLTTKQSDIGVALGRTSTVNLKLLAGEAGAASGTSGAGALSIDARATERAFVVSAEALADLPSPRDLSAVTRLVPMAQLDEVRVDGLRVDERLQASKPASQHAEALASSLAGLQASRLELIAAASVADGRLSVESSGSRTLNIVTAAGSNTFRGEIVGFGTGKGLTAKNRSQNFLPRSSTQIDNVRRDVDVGGTIGGYLTKNKAWFFGGYDEARARREQTIIRATTGSPAAGTRVPLDSTQRVLSAKVTLHLNNRQRLTGSIQADPSTLEGPLFPIAGPPTTWQGSLDTSGFEGVLRYDAALASRWLIEVLYGHHRQKDTYGGAGTALAGSLDQTNSPVAATGGFPFFQNRTLNRDELTLRLSKSGHGHVFDLGLDYDRLDALVTSFSGGAGQRIDRRLLSNGLLYFQHRYYFSSTPFQIASSLVSEPVVREIALHAQDSWSIGSHLTLLGGVRLGRQDVDARGGGSAISITDNWAGRVGGVFTMNGGKSKILAHAGRFFDRLPLELAIRAFGGESWCVCGNFSPTDVGLPSILVALPATTFGTSRRIDPDLRGQYTDEYVIGYERELIPTLILSGRYTYRALGRAIEDVRGPSGEFVIVNPSQGSLGRTLSFLDGTTITAPKPRRVSRRFEATARRTFAGGWQLFATYAWSKLEGNYDGPALSVAASSDMNLTPSFDTGDYLVNIDGRLSGDRPRLLKLDLSYTIHREGRLNGLIAGVSALSVSGTPQTAYGYSLAYQNWNYLLMPRGDLGRSPTIYEYDVHVGYPVLVGKRASLQVTADMFNLFNKQAVTMFDQRYNLSSNPACAGIPAAICNGDGGMRHSESSLTPIGQLVGIAASTNPDFFLAGVRFTGPFSARLGLRLRF